jgi:lysozyme
MNLDATGIAFLKAREGFRNIAYLDTKGIPTIGYGTTEYPNGKKVKLGDESTTSQCESYFISDLHAFEVDVNRIIKTKAEIITTYFGEEITFNALTQNGFNALVSLCYNIGTSAFEKSTLVRRVNSSFREDKDAISQAWLMWNKESFIKDGIRQFRVNPGLANRRAKEIDLYFS